MLIRLNIDKKYKDESSRRLRAPLLERHFIVRAIARHCQLIDGVAAHKHHHISPPPPLQKRPLCPPAPSLSIMLRQVHADAAQQTRYTMGVLAELHHLTLDGILELVDVVRSIVHQATNWLVNRESHENVKAGCHRARIDHDPLYQFTMISNLSSSGREPGHILDDAHGADHDLQLPVCAAGHLTDEYWRPVL